MILQFKMSDKSKTENDTKQAMEEARLRVVESEKEIQKIKTQIKSIQQSNINKTNQLKLSVSSVSQVKKIFKNHTLLFYIGKRSNRRYQIKLLLPIISTC